MAAWGPSFPFRAHSAVHPIKRGMLWTKQLSWFGQIRECYKNDECFEACMCASCTAAAASSASCSAGCSGMSRHDPTMMTRGNLVRPWARPARYVPVGPDLIHMMHERIQFIVVVLRQLQPRALGPCSRMSLLVQQSLLCISWYIYYISNVTYYLHRMHVTSCSNNAVQEPPSAELELSTIVASTDGSRVSLTASELS